MRPDRREFLTMGIGALAVAALPAALRARPPLVRRRIPVMGTLAEVALPSRNEGWAQRAIGAAFSELRRIEVAMSRFRTDSDVGRLNAGRLSASRLSTRTDEPEGWTPVSQDTGFVLRRAIRWAEVSRGRFDPCLGRASALWDAALQDEPPVARDFGRFAGSELWRTLEIDLDGSTSRARLRSPVAAVDLGGIAKGFAVDVAAEALRAHGVVDGLVNVGGDLVALGSDVSGDPWRIGVRSPESADALVSVLDVSDEAVATSGDYLRFFEHGGRRYHHLLDPSTGAPRATSTRSLTLRASCCTDADAAATALFGAPESVAHSILDHVGDDVRVLHHLQEVTT